MVNLAQAALASLPSSTTFIASISEWSSPLFNDLLPFAVFAIGIILGIALLGFLINIISGVMHRHSK